MNDTSPTTDLVLHYRRACAVYADAVEAVRATQIAYDEAIDTLPKARHDKEQAEAAVLARVRGETEEAS